MQKVIDQSVKIQVSLTFSLKSGLDVKFDLTMSLDDAINEGVRQGYLENSNVLRASVLADPAFGRKNTKDNTLP